MIWFLSSDNTPVASKQCTNRDKESDRNVSSQAARSNSSLNSSLSSRSSTSHRTRSSNLQEQTPVRTPLVELHHESLVSDSTMRRGKRTPSDIVADEVMYDSFSRGIVFPMIFIPSFQLFGLLLCLIKSLETILYKDGKRFLNGGNLFIASKQLISILIITN